MRALLGAGKVELRAADDDFLLVVEIVHENLAQVEDFRLGAVLDERQKDNAVGSLQIGVLVEGVQDDLRVRVLLAFDDDAHPVAPDSSRISEMPSRRLSRTMFAIVSMS